MTSRAFSFAVLCGLLLGAGCSRHTPQSTARTDQQIAGDVQAKLGAESALSGQNIQVAVDDGVVTLSGAANDAASRALAGNEAGSVSGVRTVVNNLEVQPAQTAAAPPPPQPAPAPEPRPRRQKPSPEPPQPAPAVQNAAPEPSASATTAAVAPAPAAPLPPPPAEKTVAIPAGTAIAIRMVDPLDSATASADQVFHATLANDLVADGMIAAPQGTPVLGRVVDAKDAAHFKGSALLSVELTRLDVRGRHIAVVTDTVSKQGAGRGTNTAVKTGGGAVLGTLIGALAGGGKGAAIGAVAGAGAGAGVNAVTRGQQVQLPAETLLNFTLQSPITITTSRVFGSPAPPSDQPEQPVLHQRPPAQPGPQ